MDIVWRRRAADDLASAKAHIAEHNLMAAERLFERIVAAVEQLGEMPYLGRKRARGGNPRTRRVSRALRRCLFHRGGSH